MKTTDGRRLRGRARQAAWASLYAVAATGTLTAPPSDVGASDSASALYWEARRDALEWMRRRGLGYLDAPPGGVGSGKRLKGARK